MPTLARPTKLDLAPRYWDRLFAPSSCLAIITSVDAAGRVNAASYGTCTRVKHEPVHIAFTANTDSDTARNVAVVPQFVVNLPRFERRILEQVRIVGLPFAPGVNELDKAGLTALPSARVKPPRIEECARHFECEVAWTREWDGRLMVVGAVVAASADADCLGANNYLIWDRARPAHFCGAPYSNRFVAAYEVMEVDRPYDGPEAAEFDRRERAMFMET